MNTLPELSTENTQKALQEIASLFEEVFGRKIEVREGDGYDPMCLIDEFEIWPAVGERKRLGGTIKVREWDVFEGVHIPSTDRDTPDDYDSLPRGTFSSTYDAVAAVELAIARRDIEGKLDNHGERKYADEVADEPYHVTVRKLGA